MELGVDISELDAVYLRNVPPTPANYAQRSGRAGRGGSAALVLTYCSAQSPHDQYFFERRHDMIQGVVRPPAIDLANQDLVNSHLHASWLAESGQPLSSTIAEVLDTGQPNRPLRAELEKQFRSGDLKDRSTKRMTRLLKRLASDLGSSRPEWLDEPNDYAAKIATDAPDAFRSAFARWRDLLASAEAQRDEARRTIDNLGIRDPKVRRSAEALQNMAQRQISLLLAGSETVGTDFYTYRYLATEGFLPGYNFPRLPEPVLLFTEYKATQALVFSALETRFGAGCVGFINGDERLVIARGAHEARVLQCPRDTAASHFNAGRIRFLISTEAGGEGIDLQERCATLVHVDLPWNPMRLHQRVGRLNRYGQKRPVQVYLLRNPETVEARIWALLQEKLTRIQATLSASMEEAEDISQLVIGMTGGRFFDELFAEGLNRRSDRLSDWFNAQTAQFGGTDAVEAVRTLVGNVARYDFQSAGTEIPKLDLPALEPFFRHAMQLNNRRVTRSDDGLSVATPELWRGSSDLHDRYDGLVFERSLPANEAMLRLLGVGHPLIDRALGECRESEVLFAQVKGLAGPLLIALAEDEITGTGTTVRRIIFGVEDSQENGLSCLRDWELLLRLNELQMPSSPVSDAAPNEIVVARRLVDNIWEAATQLALPFRRPKLTAIMAMLPLSQSTGS
jgi:superfamily II DNA/RNA helicase